MFQRILFVSVVLFSFYSHADNMDVNGCPNANLSGFWSVSVDWTCAGSLPDTLGWFLDTDGKGTNDRGLYLTWNCVGEKVFVKYSDHTEFSGIYGDGTTMSGQVTRGADTGCWVANHLSKVEVKRDATYRSSFSIPVTQLPPPIYGIPPQNYASPNGSTQP